jgi:signal transduction histidine kinase
VAVASSVSWTSSGLLGWRARRGPPPLAAPERTWTGSFERALFVVFGLIVVNDVVVSMAWIAQAFEVSGGVGRAAIVLSVAALVGSAVAILFGFLGPGLVYVTAGVVVGAQLAFAWATPDSSGLPGTWWAWQLMIPVCVLICAALRLRAAVPVLAVALTAYTVLRLSPASGPGHGIHATVSDLSCSCLFAVVVFVTVPAWRRTAEVSDAANRARIRSHAVTEAAVAADRQRRAAAQLLHDEVIHALRAVSLPPGAIDPATVRRLTGQACDVLAEGSEVMTVGEVGGLRPALEELAAKSAVTVRLQVSGDPRLPEPVVSAVTGAVGEALRNVERHSGVSDAVISARSVPGGLQVRVIDDGCGFDTDRVTVGGLGYHGSILGRIGDVGGSAWVASTPGSGTTVGIDWVTSQEMSRDASSRLTDLAGTRMRLITGGVVPMLLFLLIQGGLNYPRLADPTAALVGVVAAAAITLGALTSARVRLMPGWMSAALILTALCATAAGGWELQRDGNVETAYFAAGAGGPALALVAFFRPPWESITGGIAVTAAAAVMVHRMDPGWDTMERALPAVMSNLIAVAAVLAVRVTIDRMSRDVLWDEEMQRQAVTTQAQLTVGGQVLAERLGRVQRWVLPFLAGVAAGDLDPADPGIRQQATVLEAAVRDDIRLGACLDDQTRILIAHARTSGRQVEINAEPEAAGLLPADLISRLLTAALADVPPDRTVLSISEAPGEVSASLFVTPAPTGHELRSIADAAGAGVVEAPTFLLVRFTVTAEMSPQQGTVQQPARTVGSAR